MAMIEYSNGGDTTSFQILYLMPLVDFGMNRPAGRALITNSMHCFYENKQTITLLDSIRNDNVVVFKAFRGLELHKHFQVYFR